MFAAAAAAAALAVALLPQVLRAAPAPRPNIIFILTDDLGYGDLGVFFQNSRNFAVNRDTPAFATPNLDALSGEGLRLQRHYCPAPVCAPSRASLLLGVHQGHANVRDNQFDKALEDNHTLATVLREAGYATACIGKWGLQGPGAPAAQPGHPLNRGFDYFYGMLAHLSGHYHYPEQMTGNDNQGQPNSVFENTTDVKAGLANCYSTDLFTARAKKWIVDHRTVAPAQPFFLYLAYTAPHARLDVPTQAYPAGAGLSGGLQWNGTAGSMINTASGTINTWIHPDYAAATWDNDANAATPEVAWPEYAKRHATMVRRLDDAVADLVQTLKDLGADGNTLIVFTADNGPHNEAGSGGSYTYDPTFFDSFGPLDGIKRDTWEGGIRVPAFARWPGVVAAGGVATRVTTFWDWMPTFAELAGVPAPARTDGVSLAPVLAGAGVARDSRLYIEYSPGAITTPAYQEFLPSRRGRLRNQMQVVQVGDYKGVRYNIGSNADDFEIYNTLTDPGETSNLAAALPLVQQRMKERVLQMRRPGGGVTRPYDAEAVPPASLTAVLAGLEYRAFEGAFPWVPDFTDLVPATTGTCAGVDLAVRTRDNHIGLEFTGYLDVPADGTYTVFLATDGRAFLRLHDSALIDADAGYTSGTERSASVPLKAGRHPVTLRYVRGTGGVPSLTLQWSSGVIAKQPIPASALVRAAPVPLSASDDDAVTPRDTFVDIPVLLNDLDDGLPVPLSIQSAGAPGAGVTAVIGSTIRYTPVAGFLGADRFSYTVTDGQSTDTAEVEVRVVLDGGDPWLPLDECAGTEVRLAGGRVAGTLAGFADPAAAWIQGRHGGALRFDGVDDQVNLSGVTPPAGAAARTVAVWVRTSAATIAPASEYPVMLGYGTNNDGTRFSFRLDNTNATWEPRLEVQSGYIIGSTAVNDGAWHHLAVVVSDFDNNGTTDISEARLYVDGVRETPSASLTRAINTAAGTATVLGASPHAANYNFTGDLDDLRIFPRALSDAEVAALAAAPRQAWAAWQYRHFGVTTGTGGDDIDGDGLPDFMEYSLRTQPRIASPEGNPVFAWSGVRPGIRFDRPLGASWVADYILQSASVLGAWSDQPAAVLEVLATDPADHRETVLLTLPAPPAASLTYLRLKTTAR
jgi:arylsulfatase A-like enzyme